MLTRHLTLVAVLALSVTPVAMAQSYPAKPIRFIVPWSAGSGTDMMARAFAQRLGEAVGQQIVVDNRGGAGAVIGTDGFGALADVLPAGDGPDTDGDKT